ncbi:hypothetical protein WB388_18075 [Streptomyces brasiliscabiei]|uniref:Uncharacterized protein n=1 Tax=Streptomyces brasiliscabiei TaxID=2736302 RepID=A0ABU8GH15_9ACTN
MICTLCDTHEIEYGSLCHSCTRATHERLTRLPRLWASLESWLTPGTSGSAQYGGRVRLAEAPLPVDSEVLDLIAEGGIVGVLEDWRAAMYETRSWDQPARATSLGNRVSIAAADLDDHLDWISRWYMGETFGQEIRRLFQRAYRIVRPGHELDQPRPTFLGHCIAVDRSGVVCGAKIYADMRTVVRCEWCLCPYPPERWLALRHFQPGSQAATDGLQSAAA